MTRGARQLLGAALLAAALAACGREPPPVIGTLPPFSLTAQDGSAVTPDRLRGRVWVVDFIFTRCPDVCPVLTQRMREVRGRLPAGPDGAGVLSLSVDPNHDTPAVLRDYAASHDATGPDWTFLTGSRDAVAALLREGFKVPFADDGPPGAPITHTDRFVLLDRDLRVRGYYRGTEPEALDALVADARVVLAERAP